MVPVFAWFWGINWLQVEFFILLNYTRRNMWKICLKILTWQCGDSGTALMVTFFTVRDCSWRPPWLFFEPCLRYWMLLKDVNLIKAQLFLFTHSPQAEVSSIVDKKKIAFSRASGQCVPINPFSQSCSSCYHWCSFLCNPYSQSSQHSQLLIQRIFLLWE